MKTIAQWLPDETFQRPSGTEILGVLAEVPGVGGMTIEQAQQTLKQAGFNPVVGSYVNSNVGQGLVAYSSPGAGTRLSSGDTVVIYPSTGHVPKPKNKKPGNRNRRNRGGGNRGR